METGWLYGWMLLPAIISFARILDVTLGTVRLIFVARGYKYLAPLIAFFEVLIWIIVISQVMKNLSSPVCYLAFAGGFAAGNFIGMWLIERLSLGMVMVRIITQQDAAQLIEAMRSRKFGVTSTDGEGARGPVKIIFTVVPRKQVDGVVDEIGKYNPKAFYTVEEVGQVEKGVFPEKQPASLNGLRWRLRPLRKGK